MLGLRITVLVISLLTTVADSASMWNTERAPVAYTSSAAIDLISGFVYGLQTDPTHPSLCIQSFTAIGTSWQAVTDAAKYTWDSNQLDSAFLILYDFDSFMSILETTIQKCDIGRFATQLSALTTTQGFFNALYALGVNIQSMADDFWNFFSDFASGYYLSAGIDFGQFLSALINFHL